MDQEKRHNYKAFRGDMTAEKLNHHRIAYKKQLWKHMSGVKNTAAFIEFMMYNFDKITDLQKMRSVIQVHQSRDQFRT